MALRGIKVIEIAGLAPAPFCGMLLADHGATVIRVDRVEGNNLDCQGRGKLSIGLNVKHPNGAEIIKKLCNRADVLIEPFRPGVMERLGLGPADILKVNPRLVYARLYGFGKDSPYYDKGGHDINFLSVSGLLSKFRWGGGKPVPPINLAADFGGGGLMTAWGIVMALFEREKSGKGQTVECDMASGAAYLASWLYLSKSLPIWGSPPGHNLLDGGAHCYDTYETKDGRWMAVGALEPKFYSQLLVGLNLKDEDAPQFEGHSKQLIEDQFKKHDQKHWTEVFKHLDACVTPVLEPEEADSLAVTAEGVKCPKPMPLLSRTPPNPSVTQPTLSSGQHTWTIMQELGYSKDDIIRLNKDRIIKVAQSPKL